MVATGNQPSVDAVRRLTGEFRDIISRVPSWLPRCIFDVGANVGQSSVRFATAFPESDIYAFEPIPESYRLLTEAVRMHPRVRLHNLALGNSNGTVTMLARGSSVGNHIFEAGAPGPAAESAEVQIRTGASLIEELGLERIDFLKIDTEGHDFEVLLGFGERLSIADFVQVEASMNPYNRKHPPFRIMEDLMRHRGFHLFKIYDQVLEFTRGGRPLMRRANPVFVNGRLVDLKGFR